MHFRTKAIHVGNDIDPTTGAVVPPIHLATTFVLPGMGASAEYDYSRTGNPTRAGFETTLTALEAGVGALAFASGMAATTCVFNLLEPGDHIVTGTDIYGGTYRLLHRVLSRQHIGVTMVDATDLNAVENSISSKTKILWIETIGNPLMSVTDISCCAAIAKRHGILLGVDNTFATPALCRPLELGADIVMHSATKYIGGHSDALGGALVVKDPALLKRLHFFQNATGGVMNPLESYLCSRGLKTLDLRIREQSKSALIVAEFLAGHPKVKSVNYPGLKSHPGHELASRQLDGRFGAMLSFEVHGDVEATRKVVEGTKVFLLAVSLGAVESLIAQPATMSHAGYAPEARHAYGITDTLIRLSIGLESPDDLIADLNQALDRI